MKGKRVLYEHREKKCKQGNTRDRKHIENNCTQKERIQAKEKRGKELYTIIIHYERKRKGFIHEADQSIFETHVGVILVFELILSLK